MTGLPHDHTLNPALVKRIERLERLLYLLCMARRSNTYITEDVMAEFDKLMEELKAHAA